MKDVKASVEENFLRQYTNDMFTDDNEYTWVHVATRLTCRKSYVLFTNLWILAV